MSAPYRIQMFGGFAVFCGDRRLDRLPTQKTEALLAYLVLQMPRGVAREVLAETLWPEGEPNAIRHRLNQAVWTVRQRLSAPDAPGDTILLSELQTLSLNPNLVSSDVADFDRSMSAARAATNRKDRTRELTKAVELYHGELLDGSFDAWTFAERLRLGEAYVEALRDLVDGHSRAGEPEEAIGFVYRLLKVEPLVPKHYADLIELHLRAGHAVSALRHYEEALRLFVTEERPIPKRMKDLGVRAEEESRRQAVLELPAAKVTNGERVHPAARVLLPNFLDGFFGRAPELSAIESTLSDGHRLITLLGIGGSGKTRLAVEAACRLKPRYTGGVIFVALSASGPSDAVTREALRTLAPGLDTSEGAPLDVLERLLPSGEPVLLVLDNLELLGEWSADEIRLILERLPSVQLLCTSRQPLDLPGEIQMPIGPLPIPLCAALPSLLANPSASLFLSRAHAVRPNLELTERNAEDVAALCQRLEGLPLALELAAGWSRTLTPKQILDQLVARANLLEDRRKDMNPRHRSMRAAIEGSFLLLTPEAQAAFVRLSTFRGGWDHAAAAHLCAKGSVVALLEELASKSMVTVDASQEPVRFSMLDVLRTFADDHRSSALATECGWLHADHYLQWVERTPPTEFAKRIGDEYTNIITALRWLQENAHIGRAMQLATALTPYWEMRGKLSEGIAWLEVLLDAGEAALPLERARAQAASGRLQWQRGEFAMGKSQLEDAFPTVQALGTQSDVLQIRFALQLEAHRIGDYEHEIALLQENLRLATEVGDLQATARCWNSMGNASIELQRWPDAQAQYEKSLQAAQTLAHSDRVGAAMINLGKLALLREETLLACQWLDRALTLLRQGGHRWHTATALLYRAKAETMMNRPEEALAKLGEAYAMATEQRVLRARIVVQIGCAFVRLGRGEVAAMAFGLAERMAEDASVGRSGVELNFMEGHIALLRESLATERLRTNWQLGRHMTDEELSRKIEDERRLILV